MVSVAGTAAEVKATLRRCTFSQLTPSFTEPVQDPNAAFGKVIARIREKAIEQEGRHARPSSHAT